MALIVSDTLIMNILIVSPSFGSYGGIEAFVCALARSLSKCSDTRVTLCFKKAHGFRLSRLLRDNAELSCDNVLYATKASLELWSIIRQADIVHCQNPCIDVSLFSKILRKPLVLTIHNYRKSTKGLWEASRTIAFLLANRRWYNSNFVWSTWEGPSRISSSEKLPVVSDLPEGVTPLECRKGFVFISRWIPNKGIGILVEAYARANISHTEWPLVLMGDGPLRHSIEVRIADLGIQGVQILGVVSNDVRNHYIRYARWMVTPPHTNEDMGLTPFEARNVGVPCIVTRDGGLPEAAGLHSLICEPADIESLREKLEIAARMSDSEYNLISLNTRDELLANLQPLSVYYTRYMECLS